VLTTGRVLEQFHTGTMTRKTQGLNNLAGPRAMISVQDAEALGIGNGDMLKVSTRRGEIEIAAFVTKRMQAGVVFIPFHFVESPVNRLTTTATDPHAKIPEFKVVFLEVRRNLSVVNNAMKKSGIFATKLSKADNNTIGFLMPSHATSASHCLHSAEINLNGEWRLTSPQRPDICVPMPIPGDNVSALLQAGIIDDPYWGENEKQAQWIAEVDWHIERSLWLDESLLQRAKALPFVIPSAMGNNQLPNMNLIRKTQCHSGWDWGICLMVSGIYDDIELQVVNHTWLKSFTTEQQWHDDGSVKVLLSADIETTLPTSLQFRLAEQERVVEVSKTGVVVCEFEIEKPQLWWPNGYGEQRSLSSMACRFLPKGRTGSPSMRCHLEKHRRAIASAYKVRWMPI